MQIPATSDLYWDCECGEHGYITIRRKTDETLGRICVGCGYIINGEECSNCAEEQDREDVHICWKCRTNSAEMPDSHVNEVMFFLAKRMSRSGVKHQNVLIEIEMFLKGCSESSQFDEEWKNKFKELLEWLQERQTAKAIAVRLKKTAIELEKAWGYC